MGDALAWINQIAEWLGLFIPRWKILPITLGGIKLKRGRTIVEMAPGGIYWYWPAMTVVDTYPVVRQTDNLPSQTFLTKSRHVITVSGMVIYEVSDVVKLLTTTHDPQRAITDISLAAIHGVCCEMDLDQLHAEQGRGTLDTKLKNAAKKQLEDYGVRVLKVQLTDLAPARVLRLVQSTSKDAE